MKVFIHGINTSKPEKSIGKLRKDGESNHLFSYGRIGVLGALFKNKSIAKKLAKFIKGKDPITIYAHSNGNAVSVIAADKYGAEIKNLICIAPALNKNLKFPGSIQNILVLSTKHDKAVKAARFFDSIPVIGWLVPDIWGSMGSDNYIGDDPRVTRARVGDYVDEHSDYFSDEDLPKVTKVIDDWLEKTG